MTEKQKLFIAEYLKSWNATQAALAAGYSERSAASIGSENLKKPKIAQAISKEVSARAMGRDEVLIRLAEHARGDMADFILIPEEGEEGGAPRLDLAKAQAAGRLHLLKKATFYETAVTDKDGGCTRRSRVQIELHDAQAALDKIARAHSVYTDRVEHVGEGGGPIKITEVVVERPARRARDMAD